MSESLNEATFQYRVRPWMMACFGPAISADTMERNHRFFEEAAELTQACGMTADEAHQLVDYVWGRPVGEREQEVGGVMVTLAALCLAQHLDMFECGETELERIWTKVEEIRAKQAAKPKHSPLPEHVAAKRTPASRWVVNGEADPHGDRYDCERAELAMGDLTDDELANAVFMHGNESPRIDDVLAGRAKMPIVYLTAAKDRIRWLSRKLAQANHECNRADLRSSSFEKRMLEVEKDASRYRWLRAPDAQPPRELDVCDDDCKILEGSELDAAIDAARKGDTA